MSQFNAPSYDIERPTGECAFTGRVLEPGERYVATLVEPDVDAEPVKGRSSAGGGLGLKRLDVSLEAWQQGNRPGRLFSYWHSTIPEPNQKKKLFVDDAVLLNLLRRLGDDDRAQRQAFRFVLALILMRKKMIRFDGSERREAVEDGEARQREWWRFTPKLDPAKGPMGKWNDEETIEVLNPELDDDRIQQVTLQLGEVLEAEV